MFDLFAMLLSSIASFLFPIFASYKALKSSDPAQLAPWLMYWVVFSIGLLVESWLYFALWWIPFYGYIRLFFLLYLILPQTQGARVLYEEKVHPFLSQHESNIDDFIASSHDRLKTAGISYLRQAIEYLKTNIFNMPPTEHEPSPSASSAPQSYTQSLLARFSVPTARWAGAGAVNTGNEFYSLLASAVSAATSGGGLGGGSDRNMSDSGTLIPPHVQNPADKMSFIAAQRERLNILLGALDREAQEIQRSDGASHTRAVPGGFGSDSTYTADEDEPTQRPPSGLSMFSGLSKSKSETDFEKVEAESGAEEDLNLRRRHASGGGSWVPWGWGSGTDADASARKDD